jgi:cell wall assembly regulator SMI1
MGQPDDVRALFAGYEFGAPCTESDICGAEAELGEPLPPALRELYCAFDGFRGPTGATFFWPLFGREGLVEMNRFYRRDPLFPQGLVSQCVFFGDDGCGPQWGLMRDLPGNVIRWDAEWGSDFEVAGASPLDAWRAAKESYDSLSEAE